MRILLIRHGDPDYERDTLTEKGHREAALLADIVDRYSIDDCYMSPLGRAQHTAQYCLERLHKTAQVKDWLREFPAVLDVNRSERLQNAYLDGKREDGSFAPRILWDMAPGYLTQHPDYFHPVRWRQTDAAKCSNLVETYDWVIREFDALLASYGYVYQDGYYHVASESEKTIALFCHFGISAVLLSHLWGTSPFIPWHSLCMAPTSVTEVVTEERQRGIAYFRTLRLGDISHLMIGGEPPAFAARFCETYSNAEQRH